MNCPACGNAMTEMKAGEITVNACKGGCGGIWFDEWELQKVDHRSQSAGEALLDIPRDPAVKVDMDARRHCPRDPKMVLMRHFFSVDRKVTVDECPECAGVFLDPGELREIRSEFATDEERHKAADAYYGEMFDGQLNAMLAQDRAKEEKAQKLAHAFRFICPSYYVPGKQRWGAF